MRYPEFKESLNSLVSGFLGELDSVYNDPALSIEEKMERFNSISVKYHFPIPDVQV